MARSDWQHNLEPAMRGLYAFRLGQPVSANPLIGQAAREWTAGWKRGLAQVSQPAAAEPAVVPAPAPASIQRH
jgi:hypothetical protein